jgi:hypothetical protein
MPPQLKWYDSLGVELSAAFSIVADPGAAGTAVTLQLINNKDGTGAATATNIRVKGLFRDVGETRWLASGHEMGDNYYVEAKISAGINKTVRTTDYVPLGPGAYLDIPNLGNDEGVEIDVRLNPPAEALDDQAEIAFRVETRQFEPSVGGLTEAAGDGIYLGLDNERMTYWITAGDATEDATPDMDVLYPDLVWISEGQIYGKGNGSVTLSTVSAGNERWAFLTGKNDGTVAVVYGTEVTAPATESDKPALPAGSVKLCEVLIDDGGVINDTDITNDWGDSLGFFGFTSSGLTATLGSGLAHVSNGFVIHRGKESVSLTASSTNYIFINSAGAFEITTDGSKPTNNPRALLIYEATTDGSGVTALVDRRVFTGRMRVIRFEWLGTLSTGDFRYATLPRLADSQIQPIISVVASIGTNAGTSGNTTFDVDVEDGSWATIFTDASLRPTIAWDDSPPVDLAAIPSVYQIPAGARVRAEVDGLPSGGTPTDAALELLVFI